MKLLYRTIALLIAGVLSTAAFAAPTSAIELKSQGVAHDALFAIAFDGANGIAAGAPGKIMSSKDSGESWTADEKFPTPLAMLGVDIKGERAIAVGQMGAICVRTTRSGWTKVASGSTERLMNVAFNRRGLAVAVGAFGTVLKSSDYGNSWTPVMVDFKPFLGADQVDQGIQPHFSAVSVGDDGVITIAGEFSLILRSADAGASWTALHKGEPAIFALELRADGVGYAVGQDGLILRSSDGGANWAQMSNASKANLLGVRSAGSRAVASAMHDMLTSTDDGHTWKNLTAPDVQAGWYSGVGVTGNRFMTVGFTGRIVQVNASP